MYNTDNPTIDRWLAVCIQGRLIRPPATLYQEIAARPHLRDLLLGGPLGAFINPSGPAATCELCRGQLSALADWEQSDVAAAWRRYGAAVSHLMKCAYCAEMYAQIRVMLDLDDVLPALPRVGQPRMPARLRVERRTLAVFSDTVKKGYVEAHRGADDVEYVPERQMLTDQVLGDGTTAMVFLSPETSDLWTLTVTTTPPRQGTVEIAFAHDRFQLEFNAAGVATLGLLPSRLVLSAAGPALSIHF